MLKAGIACAVIGSIGVGVMLIMIYEHDILFSILTAIER